MELRPTKSGYIVYRDNDLQFVVERQDNCIALIPARMYTELVDEQIGDNYS